MRKVRTRPPSFPEAVTNAPIPPAAKVRWQVLCGDTGHWRAGLYSPPESTAAQLGELERHDCPEFFLLIEGALTLVLADGDVVRELPLEMGLPVLVSCPHSGYCPGGPGTGTALVVERDAFETEYRSAEEWLK
jgi:hypothetical protein